MLVDSHCHLEFDSFDHDRDEMILRARRAGIGTMVTICTRFSRFDEVAAVAGRDKDIWCSVGVHPHHVAEEGVIPVEDLITASLHPKVIGIGETGLDYHYDNSPRDLQRESFRNHIAAARRAGLPVIIHNRESDEEMCNILKEEWKNGPYHAVLHCFSSSRALAEVGVELGLYISLSGIVTFRNAGSLRDIVADLPDDRLLLETDAPFLAPVPNRGKRNEPSFLVHTAAEVARVRNVDVSDLRELSTQNFFSLFNKCMRPDAAT